MRTYEALYIVTPEMDDDGVQTVARQVESLITDQGGAIVRSEIWGRRKMAYDVKKHSEGNYILLRFEAQPETIARLETYFKLSDPVIRFLVTHFDAHTLRMEAEQARRREEDLKASAAGGRGRGRDDDDDDDDGDDRGGRRRGRDYDDDED